MGIDKEAIAQHLKIIGVRKKYCVFGGRPEWDGEKARYSIPRSSPKKRTEWIFNDKIVKVLDDCYSQEWTVWISLNDKEIGEDTILGVRSVSVFWFDFDAPRKDKAVPASEEEKLITEKEMEKFREWMAKKFSAVGFAACSGNGYHIFYPVDAHTLSSKKERKEFNEKQRTLFKSIRKESGADFDTATDIKRVTQPIGGMNYKIPDTPLKTYWVDGVTDNGIADARTKNVSILKAVLDIDIEAKEKGGATGVSGHLEFEELIKGDEKLKELHAGYWRKYGFKSRSEAEASIVCILCMSGFSDDEIRGIMQQCGIGKWQEKGESYCESQLRNGREFAAEHPISERKNAKAIPRFINERNKLDFGALLEHICAKYTFVTTDDTEELFYYEGGIYKPAVVKVKEEIESVLNSAATGFAVNEVIGHLQRSSYAPRNDFNKCKEYLPVKNGLLNLETFELEDFDQNKIFTYKLDVEYDPKAGYVHFKKFLGEILKREDEKIIQEFFGYCFFPDMPAHKTLWLYGIGRNGKTSLVNILLSLFSRETSVSIPLEELDGNHRFTVARLFGKLVNVTSEPAAKKAMQSVVIKKLTGGDVISAEMKNKQQTIDFVNFAKFIVLGNLFPRVSDPTLAFWERIIVIEFPHTFIGEATPNKDKEIIEKDGRSGVLNWCIDGLKRLRENNFHFTDSKTSTEMRLEFEKRSNPATAFLSEKCELKPGSIIPKSELYAAYKEYCSVEDLPIIGMGELTKQIQPYPGVSEPTQKVDDKTQRCWRGICLRDAELDSEKGLKNVKSVNATLVPKHDDTKPMKRINIKDLDEKGIVQAESVVTNDDFQARQAKEAMEQLKEKGVL